MTTVDVPLHVREHSRRRDIALICGLLLGAVAIQVTVMPRLTIGSLQAVPNLVIIVVVALALLRGVVVGASAGFVGGLLVELLTPGLTLGVIAFAGVVIGASPRRSRCGGGCS